MEACILVVDDHPINLKLACDVLESEGYTVECAMDAEEAQALVQHTAFDLILMDVALPGMDGLELTRLLKADPATRHIPIVALTAFAMKGDDRKAMEAGCDGYIAKPINIHKLREQVAEVLQHRSHSASER
jgi:CheY-like chemotaxis protein